ncbi:hypothetical protein IWW38_001985 [Coemansia aciculifera]|uniref:Uncharacterized protein n=1 Tax=Coemansia aciculifera TaxID=417176 RepID=A0ACC1M5R3_9FUNG|nr:hypothetical protein IWW38_001985 [Coemansia aciculifera]
MPSASCTPTKRSRKDGLAVTQFRTRTSRLQSDYNMWWHCLNVHADMSFLGEKPRASLRLRVFAAQHVIRPHLFSAQAEIVEVLLGDEPLLVAGHPLTLLLSFAMCLDANSQIAARMMNRLKDLGDSAEESAVVEVHQPWRIQGRGDTLCLLISRFFIA